MTDVKVAIEGKNRKVGAMVKALAVETAGFKAVSGTDRAFLDKHGFYIFHFETMQQVNQFRKDIFSTGALKLWIEPLGGGEAP